MTIELNGARVPECFGDKLWRLSNLYKIKDKNGQVVTFTPNWAQKLLLKPHYLNKNFAIYKQPHLQLEFLGK